MSSERAIRRDEGERLARVSISLIVVQTELMLLLMSTFFSTVVCSASNLQEYSVPFMETSAKTGVNVELAFIAVAKYDTLSSQQPFTIYTTSVYTWGALTMLTCPLGSQNVC